MLESRFAKPAKYLQPFVRFYVQRKARIQGPAILHPVPARAAAMLEFDFADPVDVYLRSQNATMKSYSAAVVGPQTYRRVDLRLQGTLESFVVMFQPAGLHQLFSIPMHNLIDQEAEAHAALGSGASRLHEQLANSPSFEDRVRLMNQWLSRHFARKHHISGVSAAAGQMLLHQGCIGIPRLARQTGLSLRQFERSFTHQVGCRPKLFARIVRFEAALRNKACFTGKSWTDTAHDFGYYDQMHMIHDFAEFTGETPARTLLHLESVFAEQLNSIRLGKPTGSAASGSELLL